MSFRMEPRAAITTGTVVDLSPHIRSTSISKSLYLISFYYYYYGSTNVWMPRVKNKSFGWAANRNQPQHRLKFVVTITQ